MLHTTCKPAMSISITDLLYCFLWPWLRLGGHKQKAKSVDFVFSHIFQLIRTESRCVAWAASTPHICRVEAIQGTHSNTTLQWQTLNQGELTDCLLAVSYHFHIGTYSVVNEPILLNFKWWYSWTLHFDINLHLRSQDYKKTRTCATILL